VTREREEDDKNEEGGRKREGKAEGNR